VEDFSALASRIAVGVGEVRGCLILSRDGLVLGSFPPGEEHLVKPAWVRFAAMGDPEKGFVEFADELWVYVRRGPYAAFAVAGTGIRPGLLMEHLEQALFAAEEARSKREALRIPEAPPAPSGRPRTSLHREVRPVAPVQAPGPGRVAGEGSARPAAPAAGCTGPDASGPPPAGPGAEAPTATPTDAEGSPSRPGGADAPGAPEAAEGPGRPGGAEEGVEEEAEVDRVLLAQEFSRLLQESRLDDEA
jgi:hypothetical protein